MGVESKNISYIKYWTENTGFIQFPYVEIMWKTKTLSVLHLSRTNICVLFKVFL